MRHGRRFAAASLATLVLGWCLPVQALRPYEGTDAAVAPPSEFELEFGYLSYLREGSQRSLVAPAAVLNFGLANGTELVIEGRLRNRINPDTDIHRHSFEGGAVSIKQVHRDGVLQDAAGPSLASECGVLLPSLAGESLGAACAGIASVRWKTFTAHLNAAVARNRDQHGEYFGGVIVEGPMLAGVRPVFETYGVRESTGEHVESVLVGLLWPLRDNLSFDIAVRRGRDQGANVTELRAGFTWTRPSHH